jgi:hypothetical protein
MRRVGLEACSSERSGGTWPEAGDPTRNCDGVGGSLLGMHIDRLLPVKAGHEMASHRTFCRY